MLWYGCNPNRQSPPTSSTPKQIIAIGVAEAEDSWNCVITGNIELTFSAINNLSPAGLLLYFHDTSLRLAAGEPLTAANEIIGFIEAEEFMKGKITNSRILIGLNVARPYRITPNSTGIKISFPKLLAESVDSAGPLETPAIAEPPATLDDVPTATLLKQVSAVPMKDYIIINLEADGAIQDYRSFSIDNPARIVFDLNNLESRLSQAPTIPIDSQWVKQIRYNLYPDKIRLVLDTEKQFLAAHFSFSTPSGLLIYIGQMPAQIRD